MNVNGQFFERDNKTPIGGRINMSAVIRALKSHARWTERFNPVKLESDKMRSEFKAANIVEGCLCIMASSASCDICQWLTRQPHRKQLNRPRRAVWSVKGRKAIRELLELTISELEASLVFRPDVFVGPLDAGNPRRSLSHLDALRKGSDRYHRHRQELRQAALARTGP